MDHDHAILFDFGSTYTKATVVSLAYREVVCSIASPSTVRTDASIAMESCLERIKQHIGERNVLRASYLACSSAAGGFRMVVIGITPSLSAKAGVNASLGAGARVIKTYSNKLSVSDLHEIKEISPESILLCGGTDNPKDDSRVIRNISTSTMRYIKSIKGGIPGENCI